MTKTFWLSFVDPDQPEGQRFLGVALVQVTEEAAREKLAELAVTHPQHLPGAEWVAAAMAMAWAHGCNPGGELGSWELPPAVTVPPRWLHRLLTKAEAQTLERELAGPTRH